MNFYKVNPNTINWDSDESTVFFNDRHKEKNLFIKSIPLLPKLKSHMWLSTSGRTSQKWIALSKKAILISAQAVNQHLQSTSNDRWGLSLPIFHIGGLAILARSYLSKSTYIHFPKKWNPYQFVSFLKENKISLSSLVPTQVYDLVQTGLTCPDSLRAIVVGGGALHPSLYQKAREQGWPLLPSYGLTECCSQVATAPLQSLKIHDFPSMQILPHVKVKIVNQEIVLNSHSLLTGFIPLQTSSKEKNHFTDPKKERWFFTKDQGQKRGTSLKVINNEQNLIKILGEKVNMRKLEDLLMKLLLQKKIKKGSYHLLPVPNPREGFQIALASDIFDLPILSHLICEFNQEVSPFEKIQQFYLLPFIPQTGISKISRTTLRNTLGFPSEETRPLSSLK